MFNRTQLRVRASIVTLVVCVLFAGSFASRSVDAVQLQDPGDCKGECACILAPDSEEAFCYY